MIGPVASRAASQRVMTALVARRGFHATRARLSSPYHYPEGPYTNLPFNPKTRFFGLRFFLYCFTGFSLPIWISSTSLSLYLWFAPCCVSRGVCAPPPPRAESRACSFANSAFSSLPNLQAQGLSRRSPFHGRPATCGGPGGNASCSDVGRLGAVIREWGELQRKERCIYVSQSINVRTIAQPYSLPLLGCDLCCLLLHPAAFWAESTMTLRLIIPRSPFGSPPSSWNIY